MNTNEIYYGNIKKLVGFDKKGVKIVELIKENAPLFQKQYNGPYVDLETNNEYPTYTNRTGNSYVDKESLISLNEFLPIKERGANHFSGKMKKLALTYKPLSK